MLLVSPLLVGIRHLYSCPQRSEVRGQIPRGISFNVKEYRTFYTGSVWCIPEFPFISCISSVTEEDLVRKAFVILQAHRYEDVVFVTQSATSHATSTVQDENIFVPKALMHIMCIHCSSYQSTATSRWQPLCLSQVFILVPRRTTVPTDRRCCIKGFARLRALAYKSVKVPPHRPSPTRTKHQTPLVYMTSGLRRRRTEG